MLEGSRARSNSSSLKDKVIAVNNATWRGSYTGDRDQPREAPRATPGPHRSPLQPEPVNCISNEILTLHSIMPFKKNDNPCSLQYKSDNTQHKQ